MLYEHDKPGGCNMAWAARQVLRGLYPGTRRVYNGTKTEEERGERFAAN